MRASKARERVGESEGPSPSDNNDRVPELPEVEATRREIAPSMVRARIVSVDLRRLDLRRPFGRRFAKRLTGQIVTSLDRRAKYLVVSLSSEETLLMHLGMSGSFRVIDDPPNRRQRVLSRLESHDHVVFHMSSGRAVVFNDPRRFGMMELVAAGKLHRHAVLSRLGPEPLSDDFDAATLARLLHGKKTSLKAALLDQRVVAGLGNIYASEALHVAGLSPARRASTLAAASGAPRDAADRLVSAIKRVLERAIRNQSADYRDARFLVYDRQGEPCPRKDCIGTIRRRVQGGRSTFFCAVCQR
jgi:formamidopyrimidine-DNA glycosylase